VELHNLGFGVFFNQLTKNIESKNYKPEDTTLYVDCPYFNSTATYNENGGWTYQDDQVLMHRLVNLHSEGYHIVSSNAFHNRGKTNQALINWTKQHEDKFTVHFMNRDYSNCSSFKSDHPTVEVLIVSK
jgi:site-specific DNA-adenine methylase